MSGGERYWNEDTQRWEDGTVDRAGATPPPPSRPAHPPTAPVWPPAEPSAATPTSTWPPADPRTSPPETPGTGTGADPAPPAMDGPADAPQPPAEPSESAAPPHADASPPAGSPGSAAPASTDASAPASPSTDARPPASAASAPAGPSTDARPPVESPGSADATSTDASAPAGPSTDARPPASAAPSASTWPPADRRTPPPAAWPPAASSSTDSTDSPGSTEPHSPAWPPSAPADPPTASWPPADSRTAPWPPAHHPDPPSASWSPTTTNPEPPVTAPWPPVDPVPEPPARDSSRRVLWLVIVGAAVAGVAVSLVLTQVVGRDKGDDARPVVRHSSSAPVTPSASPSPSPTPSPSAPPAGYELRDDSEGFRVAVPEGWTRAEVPSQYGMSVVNFRSPDRERRLQVYEVSEASPDASFDLYLSDQTAKPRGFEKLALTNLDEGDFTGSRLEYLADAIRDEPEVGTWHVYDERFVAADGKIYALAAYGANADGGEDELELLTTALAWFCPPGMNCDPTGNAALD
ncbi:hypothetical protein ACIPPM_16325 [Streptomyces sp. NPDC090119]|uniref:hypothetical protein n=1 Tax=Streptomyces sp. NPDC090119 TaxID=3365951 RepID=UPI0038114C4B